ncbi:MAG TPA: regulatory protein RecX, partial [Gammaproteobacteria bacterium]
MSGPRPRPEAAPRARALDLLARREHSRAELRRKLGGAGSDPAELDAVLDQLAAAGLQSDARYAESYVRSYAERGDGPLKIRQGLRQRGVDGSLIDAALEAAEVDWGERLESARAKRF